MAENRVTWISRVLNMRRIYLATLKRQKLEQKESSIKQIVAETCYYTTQKGIFL